jgi:hypothetical protein
MRFFILPHGLDLFQILLINVLIFLPEVVVTVLFTVVFETGLGNSVVKLRQ